MNTNKTLSPRPSRRDTARAHAPRPRPVQRRASSRRVLVGLFALALLALAAGLLAGRCAGTPHAAAPAAYVSPYDWTGLERNGDRLAYYEDGVLRSDLGVDVSSHQGAIDWPAVAADGVDFAIVRAGNRGYTEGALYADERFAENVDGAKAAGLATGVYFFSQAVTPDEAREEADFVLGLLAGRPLDLPVAFDHEPVSDNAGRANHLTGPELAACARAFCERIEQAGYETLVYGNKRDIARFGGDDLDGRPVWFAEYDVAVPTGQFDFVMWQYTSAGTVAGISTRVDLNIRFAAAG